jgi:amino acid adenylation domain-containing protein
MTVFNVEGFRLSAQQKRLWPLLQHHQIGPAQMVISLEGKLDHASLVQAVQHVFYRHESLRTGFYRMPDMKFPLQVIAEEVALLWKDEDISTFSPNEQNQSLAEFAQREVAPLLPDQEKPSWRVVLIRRAPCHSLLLLTLSPLCADRASLSNLYSEIFQEYRTILLKEERQEEEVVQYVQYVDWQYELQTEESEESRTGTTYWKQLLAQCSISPRLPFEQLRDQKSICTPHFLTHTLSGKRRERLDALAQQCAMPVSDLLLTCWMLLLQRLSGSADVKVGCFYDGRTDEALTTSIGLFARYLPVQVHMGDRMPFSEILPQVSRLLERVQQWQDYSFAVSQQEAGDADYAYLYEYAIKPPVHALTDLTFAIDRLSSSIEPFKLKLSCYQAASETIVEWAYDSRFFLQRDVERIASYFETLLNSICLSPQVSIETLELQSRQERERLQRAFNEHDGHSIWLHSTRIPDLFEAQVARAPQQRALLYKDQCITYGELNDRSNQLAHYLLTHDIGPEMRVGVYADRSIETVIALLAVLKAGGTYVPLDPVYPQERLDMIVRDADICILILPMQLYAQAFAPPVRKVAWDGDGPLIRQQKTKNLNSGVQPDNLAYIMYTSGTTGGAKGVAISQASLCTYISALQRQIEIRATDVYAHTASVAFSSSMRQLLLPLLHGATVFIASAEQRKDPVALFEGFREQHVTVWDVVPTFWRSALQVLATDKRTNNALRLILSASEALHADTVHQWRRAYYKEEQSPRIINMYGQTETTGIVSLYPLPDQEETGNNVIPLGKSIACVKLYILDHTLQPVSLYTPGDLYVGGTSLARGYLHQPELTAERFIPDPFGTEPGARLYKTGDIACYTAEGTLEFRGREDYQIKLRGVRIVPGEIEAVLSMHPDIQDVVVVAREGHAEEQQLAAYIVPRSGKELSSGDVQSFVRQRLPDFMIPSACMFLDALPLTSNGKIDRLALSLLNPLRPRLTSKYIAPQTVCEKKLVQCWEQMLGITPIGVYDNFFELGGHSLQAIRLVATIQQTFSIDFSLSRFLSTPCVVDLAHSISQQLTVQEEDMELSQLVVGLEQLSDDERQQMLHEIESLDAGK